MYHYADGNTARGPVSLEELRGRITPSTLVWREPMTDWKPASELPDLATLWEPTNPTPAENEIVSVAAVPGDAPMMAYAPPALTPRTPGMATASLVLGILSVPMIVPFFCLWPFSIVLAVLALTFGIVARGQCRREQRPGGGMALAGIILGLIPLVIVVGIMLLILISAIASALG